MTKPMATTLATQTLSLAGEYATAAELCRRGVYCQLTLGNYKKTDLIVDSGDKFYRVSVKTKQGTNWARVTGIWQPQDLLVLVDFHGKDLETRPDFYILTVSAWKRAMNAKLAGNSDKRPEINSENTIFWPPSEGKKDGWKGCQVSIADVANYLERWPAMRQSLSSAENAA